MSSLLLSSAQNFSPTINWTISSTPPDGFHSCWVRSAISADTSHRFHHTFRRAAKKEPPPVFRAGHSESRPPSLQPPPAQDGRHERVAQGSQGFQGLQGAQVQGRHERLHQIGPQRPCNSSQDGHQDSGARSYLAHLECRCKVRLFLSRLPLFSGLGHHFLILASVARPRSRPRPPVGGGLRPVGQPEERWHVGPVHKRTSKPGSHGNTYPFSTLTCPLPQTSHMVLHHHGRTTMPLDPRRLRRDIPADLQALPPDKTCRHAPSRTILYHLRRPLCRLGSPILPHRR